MLGLALLWPGSASSVLARDPPSAAGSGGTVESTICPLVERAAQASHLPVALLTRLIWTESRFRVNARSPKGAQGIAQFMPGTAAERGLADPFDPEQAIPKAADLLADLSRQFGNVGLAAAAYNAGSNRVADWLAGSGGLPAETQAYVILLTGRAAEDWAHRGQQAADAPADRRSCTEVTASLRIEDGADIAPIAPWGVQLSGNFSKAIALASFSRIQQRFHGLLGNVQPMIIGSVMRSRGTRRFYRVMIPEASRAHADQTCQAILSRGGACVALRS